MAKLVGIFGVLALCLAIVDIIHGQHNGDAHRTYIHAAEFVFFFAFLCLLEICIYKLVTKDTNISRWLVISLLSLITAIASLILFGLAGGSFHGDGGPIAFSLLLFWTIASTTFPISFIGFVIVSIIRIRRHVPILEK
jgi:hypothetical protein